ncbi:type II secretion system protein, partial [bacterium]|nr:type II secretion system protein [bacterium]
NAKDTLCIGGLLHRQQIFDWKHHALVFISYVKNLRNRRSLLVPLRGFTLAEVLITLGIIGVVAALTIPTLMQNTNRKDTVAKVNKALSTINNATRLAEANLQATVDKWDIIYSNETENVQKWVNNVKPYLNYVQECDDSNLSDCMYDGFYKKLSGEEHSKYANQYTHSAFVLSDGTVFWFRMPTLSSTLDYYVSAYVDVNGKKGPNQIGVDLFNFILYKSSGVFEAEHESDSACDKQETGWGCAEYILMNGNMNYLD